MTFRSFLPGERESPVPKRPAPFTQERPAGWCLECGKVLWKQSYEATGHLKTKSDSASELVNTPPARSPGRSVV